MPKSRGHRRLKSASILLLTPTTHRFYPRRVCPLKELARSGKEDGGGHLVAHGGHVVTQMQHRMAATKIGAAGMATRRSRMAAAAEIGTTGTGTPPVLRPSRERG
jgi:hypothetical protein